MICIVLLRLKSNVWTLLIYWRKQKNRFRFEFYIKYYSGFQFEFHFELWFEPDSINYIFYIDFEFDFIFLFILHSILDQFFNFLSFWTVSEKFYDNDVSPVDNLLSKCDQWQYVSKGKPHSAGARFPFLFCAIWPILRTVIISCERTGEGYKES